MGGIDRSAQALVKQNRENFPVASLLLPAAHRAPILDFYRFAREADDIADSPTLPANDKIAQLQSVDAALAAGDFTRLPAWAQPYFRHVEEGKCSVQYGRALLSAFTQDATKQRYANWEELLDYCDRSAAPVGRTVLEVCGETNANLAASDALCNCLQVLNHLQDIRDDFLSRDRVYLPQDWMQQAGCTLQDLGADQCSPALRQVIHATLDRVQALLITAESLPRSVSRMGIKLETALILELAKKLTRKLRTHDPMAGKVRLNFWEKLGCAGSGSTVLWS